MSPIWKGLVILSLVMNVVLTLRVFVSGGPAGAATPVAYDPAASDAGAPRDPTIPQDQQPVAPPAPAIQFTDDNSSLAQKIKGELFPEIEKSAAKSFPGLQADKLDLTQGRYVLMMKTNIDSRITRESARSLIASLMRSYTEKHSELKGREPVVRFPGDPPTTPNRM